MQTLEATSLLRQTIEYFANKAALKRLAMTRLRDPCEIAIQALIAVRRVMARISLQGHVLGDVHPQMHHVGIMWALRQNPKCRMHNMQAHLLRFL